MKSAASKDPFWRMKVALVKAALAEKNPDLGDLRETFLEEFGSPPNLELENLFEAELRKKRGLSPAAMAPVTEKAVTEPAASPEGPPPLDLVGVNLLKDMSRVHAAEAAKARGAAAAPKKVRRRSLLQSKISVLKKVAQGPDPTREALEKAFDEQLGIIVSREMMTVFRLELEKRGLR